MYSINISRQASYRGRNVYFTGQSKQVQKSIKSFSDERNKIAMRNINNYGLSRPKRTQVRRTVQIIQKLVAMRIGVNPVEVFTELRAGSGYRDNMNYDQVLIK